MPAALAPAKLNLFLHLLGKRADGYHDLQSLFSFVTIGDRLELHAAENMSLSVTGHFAAALPAGEDNLVMRVLDKASQQHHQAVAVRLEKNLPVASGIGGGSSDAATALRLYYNLLGIEQPQPPEWLTEFGADLPACYLASSCWVEGIGERVQAMALPAMPVLLVNPGLGLPTGQVFDGGVTFSAPVARPSAKGKDEWLAFLARQRNDLQLAALRLAPVIGQVLQALEDQPGCRLSRMSGSGATCFALFDTPDQASGAKKAIAQRNPAWWVENGETFDG